jgi:hypothetical protein
VGKTIIYAGFTVGGLVGAYLPVVVLHASAWGLVSFAGGTVGGLAGIWAGYRAYRYLDI